MKAIRCALVLSALTLAAAGHSPASAAGKAYPKTVKCKHCQISMTIKSAADLKKKCWVCKCKTPASACIPGAKK